MNGRRAPGASLAGAGAGAGGCGCGCAIARGRLQVPRQAGEQGSRPKTREAGGGRDGTAHAGGQQARVRAKGTGTRGRSFSFTGEEIR